MTLPTITLISIPPHLLAPNLSSHWDLSLPPTGNQEIDQWESKWTVNNRDVSRAPRYYLRSYDWSEAEIAIAHLKVLETTLRYAKIGDMTLFDRHLRPRPNPNGGSNINLVPLSTSVRELAFSFNRSFNIHCMVMPHFMMFSIWYRLLDNNAFYAWHHAAMSNLENSRLGTGLGADYCKEIFAWLKTAKRLAVKDRPQPASKTDCILFDKQRDRFGSKALTKYLQTEPV